MGSPGLKKISPSHLEFRYKSAQSASKHDFYELAISVLSLPHSNAEVERLFSQLNIHPHTKD